MNVIVDMIFAEAVVALTAGTVAEFQIWIVCIGSTADCTLFRIRLIAGLPVDAIPLPSEIGGGFALCSAVQAGVVCNIVPTEQDKVQSGNDRQQIERKMKLKD